MVATLHRESQNDTMVDKLIVVSSDCHIGPRLADLRPYCPVGYLEAFDDYAMHHTTTGIPLEVEEENDDVLTYTYLRNRKTAGHYDMATRRLDMDRDGVAAEVIFHGSQNEEPIPFVVPPMAFAGHAMPFSYVGIDQELTAVGVEIYNRWLADAVSIEKERHVGLAHIPAWDVHGSIRTAEWAGAHGLKGVNFPAWRPGMAPLQDERWEPFWAACAAMQLPLCNHAGAGDDSTWPAAEASVLLPLESTFHSKRLIWSLIYHGVFERHPGLKLVITEVPGTWWTYLMKEMDSPQHQPAAPRLPSEYCETNVFHAATFLSREEAHAAVDGGYEHNVLWGSDYPHVEGTWQYSEDDEEEPQTHLSLRFALAGLPEASVKAMVGLNAIEVFGLDEARLQAIANKITAPTVDELAMSLDVADIPRAHGVFAFRTVGPWG